ncbi:MAG: GTPase domain-containing protein [Anaerolineae bacterium]|nr:GTPase domain-containing protein [Phycisphaerae bacterium]
MSVNSVDSKLSALLTAVEALRASASSTTAPAIERFSADLAAARFHLKRDVSKHEPIILAVLGGTGTGKSTLVNRLLDAEQHPLTASSFRRTFTAGPVAIVHESNRLPERWLGIDHVAIDPAQIPARGRTDALSIIPNNHDLTRSLTLIDTPDLDGDQLAHHAQADRVFRWADAVLFLVTPEKYQMTELLPYYRLAKRYELPALFVMNKVEEQAVVDDYGKQIEAPPFAIPRDDASYTASADANLDVLKTRLTALMVSPSDTRQFGLKNRTIDLLDRLRDQILAPLTQDRKAIDQIIASLRAMETPSRQIDVSPMMSQLRRRLQQRSVLYLMGPTRVLDRVRQVPGLLARLPRTTWDWIRTGQVNLGDDETLPPELKNGKAGAPDFHSVLADQMRIVQARIEDAIVASPQSRTWMAQPGRGGLDDALIDPNEAGNIASDELNLLKEWLNKKWNATPRDTAVLSRLIKHLPGGEKLTRWSEAAPYLLAAVVATHHAFFGPVDLMVIGGWSLATYLTERLSNEVASRTRETNRAINRRFEQLAHQQINRAVEWLNSRAPTNRSLDELKAIADRISETLE